VECAIYTICFVLLRKASKLLFLAEEQWGKAVQTGVDRPPTPADKRWPRRGAKTLNAQTISFGTTLALSIDGK
jgi:hypothetical protein